MSFYRLLTNTGIQSLIQFWCSTGNKKMCAWATANIPNATEVRDFLEQDPVVDLADIINARLDRLDKARSSTSIFFNEPDYLPSAFLERGLRCSSAVCLLKRGFWIEDLIELIKDRYVKDITEILLPLSEKIELFEEKWPGGSQDVWEADSRVSDALEHERIKEVLGQFRDELKKLSAEEKQYKGTVFIPFATGFLVSKNYLLTNFHVFNEKDKDNIKNFIAEFRYEQDALGQSSPIIKYHLDPDKFCISDEKLDYTLIRVKAWEDDKADDKYSRPAFPEAGENFGWLPMLMDSTLIAPPVTPKQAEGIKGIDSKRIPATGLVGEPVFLIQHPRGVTKRIVLFNNQVQDIYQNFLQYQADADFGSSGSPIFNSQWQLVGLHHAALVKWDDEKPDEQKLEVQGNLGIRICEIVKHLETRRSEPGVAEFLDNKRYVVKQKEQPLKGRIYILVGHQRGDAPSPEHLEQEVTLAKTLLESIFRFSKLGFEVIDVLQECDDKYEAGIDYINQQNYQSGDVALEFRIRTRFDPGVFLNNDVAIYYADDKSGHQAYANIFFKTFLNKFYPFSNTELSVDNTSKDMQFCRGVTMPSLILTLDVIGENYETVKRELNPSPEEQRPHPFEGIWDALESWVKVISPIGFWSAD